MKEIKMKNKTDVKAVFESEGYKVTTLRDIPTKPNYTVEKDGIKKTVDVIEYIRFNDTISRFVYKRIMAGGFFVMTPPLDRHDNRGFQIFSKDDIDNIAECYHIWWKDRK